MEKCMFKKIASSFLIASALVGSIAAPSLADDSTFQTIVYFPVRVLGAGVGTVVGVPLGATKDGTRGFIKSTQWVAGKLGNEDGKYHQIAGGILGGPFGLVGGGAYGCFDGSWHGLKTGFEQPFSKEAFTFKDE
jgi:hypothetical protein